MLFVPVLHLEDRQLNFTLGPGVFPKVPRRKTWKNRFPRKANVVASEM